eukprot:jgi/Chrzof1/749/Cz01g27080.t1
MCTAMQVLDDYTFKLTLSAAYYPALQELTLIRPVRFISPRSLSSNPAEKSCPTQTFASWRFNVTEFRCVGVRDPAGTGPLVFVNMITSDREISASQIASTTVGATEVVKQVNFRRNKDHWDTQAGGNIDNFVVKLYGSLDEVSAAVSQGEVDMVFGLDTLRPTFFKELHQVDDDDLETYISGPMSTRLIQLNSGSGVTSSLAVRRAILHAVNKQAIIRTELAGLEQPAYTLFSPTVPYCDVDLSPLVAYDRDKTISLLEDAGWVLPPGQSVRQKNGTLLEVKFLFTVNNSIHQAIEDDIRSDVADVGIRVIRYEAPTHDDFNLRHAAGDWDLAFTKTSGTPYDPHSYAVEFKTWGAHVKGLSGLSGARLTEGFQLAVPATNDSLSERISAVLLTTNEADRSEQWADILTILHEQAVFMPLSYMVNVAIVNKRYENFQFGAQQWDLPLHKLVDSQLLRQGAPKPAIGAGAIAAIVICGTLALLAVAGVVFLVVRERRGRPVFQPLIDTTNYTGKDLEFAVK